MQLHGMAQFHQELYSDALQSQQIMPDTRMALAISSAYLQQQEALEEEFSITIQLPQSRKTTDGSHHSSVQVVGL